MIRRVTRGVGFMTALASASPTAGADPSAAAEGGDRVSPPTRGVPISVTVRGTPAPIDTSSSSLLVSRHIRSAPLRTAEDSLQLVPGMTLVQHGSEGKGQQVLLRGIDALHGSDLEVTIDGLAVNEPSNVHAQGYLDLGFVIPEMIRMVRVTKGPFGIEQGPFSLAGTAAYTLGVPEDELGWRVGYGYGTSGRHRLIASYAPQAREGHDFTALEVVRDAGFGERRSLEKGAFMARATLMDDERGRLSLLAASYVSRFDLPGTLRSEDVERGVVDFYDAYDDDMFGLSARSLGLVSYVNSFASHAIEARAFATFRHLELRENFTGFLLDPEHGDRRLQQHQSWKGGLEVRDDVAWTRAFSMQIGMGASLEDIRQAQERLGVTMQRLATEQALQARQVFTSFSLGGRVKLGPPGRPWGAFDAGARVDGLHLRFGTRTEVEVAWSPRATLRVDATDELSFLAAYGRGARPPEARARLGYRAERAGLSSPERARPSSWVQSHSAELGARWRFTPQVRAALSGFASTTERESVFDHVAGTTVDLDSTRRIGAELVLSAQPRPWLTVSADATWVKATFVRSGNPVPFVPPLSAALRALVTHPHGWRTGVHVTALAARPLPHAAVGSASATVDATFGYHWAKYRFDLALENVLGQELREGEYHYASHWARGEEADRIPALHVAAGPPFNAHAAFSVLF